MNRALVVTAESVTTHIILPRENPSSPLGPSNVWPGDLFSFSAALYLLL